MLLLALVGAAAWSLLGLTQHYAGSSAVAAAGPTLLAGADPDEGVVAAAGPPVVVVLLGAVLLVGLPASVGADAVASAPLRARAPPAR